MMQLKYSLSLIVFIALALVVLGCAKPPEAEKSAAKTAMDAAVSAGAGKYATADFEAAKSLWDASEAQVTEKKIQGSKTRLYQRQGCLREGYRKCCRG